MRDLLPLERIDGDLLMPRGAYTALVNLGTVMGGGDTFFRQVTTLLLTLGTVPAAMAALELVTIRLAGNPVTTHLATLIIPPAATRSVPWLALGIALVASTVTGVAPMPTRRRTAIAFVIFWLLLESSFILLVNRVVRRDSRPTTDFAFLAVVEFGATLAALPLCPLPWAGGVAFVLSIGAALVTTLALQTRHALASATFLLSFTALIRFTSDARSHIHFTTRRRELDAALAAKQPLLRRLLPRNAVRFLLSSAAPVPTAHRSLGLVRLDVEGFTAACQRVKAEKMMAWLHDCYRRADAALVIAGGFKIDVLGDAYVAAFGTLSDKDVEEEEETVEPVADRLAIARVFAARLHEILRETPSIATAGGRPLELGGRVGVHVGDAVACVTGSIRVRQQLYGDALRVLEETERAAPRGGTAYSDAARAILEEVETLAVPVVSTRKTGGGLRKRKKVKKGGGKTR